MRCRSSSSRPRPTLLRCAQPSPTPTSNPPRTCTHRPTTAGISPRCSPSAPSPRPPTTRGAEATVEAGTIPTSRSIAVTVNGRTYEREVEARKLLIHFIRDDLDLTGSHVGCDTGNCGACSVIIDG